MFDPACFYGHNEYDLAIATVFGGFLRQFWDPYHAVISKAAGWNNRHKLYKLFHNLNHSSVLHYIYLIITNTHTHTHSVHSLYSYLHYTTLHRRPYSETLQCCTTSTIPKGSCLSDTSFQWCFYGSNNQWTRLLYDWYEEHPLRNLACTLCGLWK